MIASSFLFALMALIVKLLGRFGPFELVFWRSVIMFPSTLGLMWYRGIYPWGESGQRFFFILRGTAGFFFMGTYYFSIQQLALGDAVVITYTSPVLTAIVAAVLLNEPLELLDLAGSLLCMVGVVLVSQPSFIMTYFGAHPVPMPVAGVAGALCSAMFATSVSILLRYRKDLNPLVSTNYFAIVGIFTSPFFMLAFGEPWVVPDRVSEWFLMIPLALLSVFGQILMNIGLQRESAGKATVMNYIQVVFANLFQITLLHEETDRLKVSGAALIASWGAIALFKDARSKGVDQSKALDSDLLSSSPVGRSSSSFLASKDEPSPSDVVRRGSSTLMAATDSLGGSESSVTHQNSFHAG